MKIKKVDSQDFEAQKIIRWMDAEVFPEDFPVTFTGSHWFIGYDGPKMKSVCYAAWRPHYPMTSLNELHWTGDFGFLYRAGVLVEARGKGYQKELIVAREKSMWEFGIRNSITYTDPTSAASMSSLIAEGYRPYEAKVDTNLAGAAPGKITKFVHWRKKLLA